MDLNHTQERSVQTDGILFKRYSNFIFEYQSLYFDADLTLPFELTIEPTIISEWMRNIYNDCPDVLFLGPEDLPRFSFRLSRGLPPRIEQPILKKYGSMQKYVESNILGNVVQTRLFRQSHSDLHLQKAQDYAYDVFVVIEHKRSVSLAKQLTTVGCESISQNQVEVTSLVRTSVEDAEPFSVDSLGNESHDTVVALNYPAACAESVSSLPLRPSDDNLDSSSDIFIPLARSHRPRWLLRISRFVCHRRYRQHNHQTKRKRLAGKHRRRARRTSINPATPLANDSDSARLTMRPSKYGKVFKVGIILLGGLIGICGLIFLAGFTPWRID